MECEKKQLLKYGRNGLLQLLFVLLLLAILTELLICLLYFFLKGTSKEIVCPPKKREISQIEVNNYPVIDWERTEEGPEAHNVENETTDEDIFLAKYDSTTYEEMFSEKFSSTASESEETEIFSFETEETKNFSFEREETKNFSFEREETTNFNFEREETSHSTKMKTTNMSITIPKISTIISTITAAIPTITENISKTTTSEWAFIKKTLNTLTTASIIPIRIEFGREKRNFTDADAFCRNKYRKGRLMVLYNQYEESMLIEQLTKQPVNYFKECPRIYIGYRVQALGKFIYPIPFRPMLPLDLIGENANSLYPGISPWDVNCATITYIQSYDIFNVQNVPCFGRRYHCYICEVLQTPKLVQQIGAEYCNSLTCLDIRVSRYRYRTAKEFIRNCRRSKGRLAMIGNMTVPELLKNRIKNLKYSRRVRCGAEPILVYNVLPTPKLETIRSDPIAYRTSKLEYSMSKDNCISISYKANYSWIYTPCTQVNCFLCRDDDANPPPYSEPELPTDEPDVMLEMMQMKQIQKPVTEVPVVSTLTSSAQELKTNNLDLKGRHIQLFPDSAFKRSDNQLHSWSNKYNLAFANSRLGETQRSNIIHWERNDVFAQQQEIDDKVESIIRDHYPNADKSSNDF